MDKMYAINVRYFPKLEGGWESGGQELPTFYIHPQAQMTLDEGGAAIIANSMFAPFLRDLGEGYKIVVHSTEVDI